MTVLDALLSADERAALHRPTGSAHGLPARCYGEEAYRLEQKHLFPSQWCPVGFVEDVAEPGDARPVDLAGWPLLMVRDRAGRLRVFHNICSHRADRLLDEPCSGLRRLTCPWHHWAYDLDGRLAATPRLGGETGDTAEGFDRDGLGLKEVRCDTSHGFVMLNLDGRAAPLCDHLAPLDTLLGAFALDRLKASEPWTIHYPCNWKIAQESAVEDYHVACLHPQLVRGVNRLNVALHAAPGIYYGTSTAKDSPGAYADLNHDEESLPDLIGPRTERRAYVLALFPNGHLLAHPQFLWHITMMPEGATRTRIESRTYIADDGTDRTRQHEAASHMLKDVLLQDVETVGRVQANYESPAAESITPRFSPFWEPNVLQFQRDVVAALDG